MRSPAAAVTLSAFDFVTGVRLYISDPPIPANAYCGLGWIAQQWGFPALIHTWTLLALFTGTIGLAWIRVQNEPLAMSLLYGFYRVVRDFVTRSAISRN